MIRIGFLVNPYAGSGGRIGLKGSDGIKILNPETPSKIARFLNSAPKDNVIYITPSGMMGEIYFSNSDFKVETLKKIGNTQGTTAEDTIKAVREMINRGVKLIIFAGGDGTARDVVKGLGKNEIPIIGIPTGVKMHSGVFAETPEAVSKILNDLIKGNFELMEAEILDVDEEEYRRGNYVAKLYGYALTIKSKYIVPSKEEIKSSEEELEQVARYVLENMENDIYYIMGPGSTVKYIERKLGIESDFLSTDVIFNKKLIKKNANYFDLLKISANLKIVVTPIGSQGFLFGRGNQEIGPEVLKKAGKEGIIVVASFEKMNSIECLRIDTGDSSVDHALRGIYRVIIGYNEFYTIKTC